VFVADGGKRYITAVQVDPDGAFNGGRGPKASAVVTPRGEKVAVQIGWEAQKGCGAIHARHELELRPDDPACTPPKPAGKIFSR
jgi:hypothetical protein